MPGEFDLAPSLPAGNDEFALPPDEFAIAPAAGKQGAQPTILGALTQGPMAGLVQAGGDWAKTIQSIYGKPTAETPDYLSRAPEYAALDKPYDFSLGMPNIPKIVYKTTKGIAESAPALAAGLAASGATIAAGGGPENPLADVAALGTGALGFGTISAMQQFGPYFANALKETPDDPDGAWTRALKQAAADGAISTATFAAFGYRPFASTLKNALFQALGVQPAVGIAGAEAKKQLIEGQNLTPAEAAETGIGSAIGALPLGGLRGFEKSTFGLPAGKITGAEVSPESPVSPPVEKSTVGVQTRPNVNPPGEFEIAQPAALAAGPWGAREVGPWGARPPETEPTLPAREDLQTATEAAPVKAIPNVEPDTFRLISQHAEIQDRLSGVEQQLAALPEGDHSAVDRLARLQEVEARLANPDIAPQERRAAMQRRDQILVDTTPEALRAAAAPIEQRRALEAQQDSLEGQLADIAKRIMPPAELAPAEVPRLGAAEAMPVRAPEEAPATEAPKTSEVAPTEAAPVRGPWGPRTPETPTTSEPSAPIPTGEAKSAAAAAPEAAPLAETPLPTPRRGVSAIGRTVQGTGETKPFGLSESVEEAAGRDLGDLPTTQVIEDAPQLARVRQIFDADPQRGMDIAMGDARPPKDVLARHFYTEAVNRAVRAGDLETTRRLATKSKLVAESKLMGAEISALRNIEPGNPAVDMTRVQDARREELAKRGVDVPRAISHTVKEIRAVRAKTAAPRDAWEKFMAEIVCR